MLKTACKNIVDIVVGPHTGILSVGYPTVERTVPSENKIYFTRLHRSTVHQQEG
jgi:hypothetical protein